MKFKEGDIVKDSIGFFQEIPNNIGPPWVFWWNNAPVSLSEDKLTLVCRAENREDRCDE